MVTVTMESISSGDCTLVSRPKTPVTHARLQGFHCLLPVCASKHGHSAAEITVGLIYPHQVINLCLLPCVWNDCFYLDTCPTNHG